MTNIDISLAKVSFEYLFSLNFCLKILNFHYDSTDTSLFKIGWDYHEFQLEIFFWNFFYYYLWKKIIRKPTKKINELTKIYLFLEPSVIKKYLVDNQNLIPVLKQIPNELKRFVKYYKLTIKVYYDKDSPYDSLDICIYIDDDIYDKHGMDLYEKIISDKFFQNFPADIFERLSLNIRPVSSLKNIKNKQIMIDK